VLTVIGYDQKQEDAAEMSHSEIKGKVRSLQSRMTGNDALWIRLGIMIYSTDLETPVFIRSWGLMQVRWLGEEIDEIT
jgi:hypothetical protein